MKLDIHIHHHHPKEDTMSQLTDAVDRVVQIVADLKRTVVEALATDATDQAEIDRLRSQVESQTSDASAAIAALADVTPDVNAPTEPPAIPDTPVDNGDTPADAPAGDNADTTPADNPTPEYGNDGNPLP